MTRKPAISMCLEGGRNGLRIAHWTPGRIRVGFDSPSDAEAFADAVRDVHGVISAKANPITGSVLIQYRPEDEAVTPLIEASTRTHDRRRRPDRCPTCRQALRSAERDALPNLVRLTGSILTGDVIGIASTLLSLSQSEEIAIPLAA